MQDAGLPVLGIIGHSKTGKTTLVERLIGALKAKGLRVATAKHHPHDLRIDKPGKDSHRHRKAGAVATMLLLPHKIALTADIPGKPDLREIVSRFAVNAHICLIEGCKDADVPKIEVYAAKGSDKPLALSRTGIVAIVTDEPVELPLPTFKRDDVEKIAAFVVDLFQLR